MPCRWNYCHNQHQGPHFLDGDDDEEIFDLAGSYAELFGRSSFTPTNRWPRRPRPDPDGQQLPQSNCRSQVASSQGYLHAKTGGELPLLRRQSWPSTAGSIWPSRGSICWGRARFGRGSSSISLFPVVGRGPWEAQIKGSWSGIVWVGGEEFFPTGALVPAARGSWLGGDAWLLGISADGERAACTTTRSPAPTRHNLLSQDGPLQINRGCSSGARAWPVERGYVEVAGSGSFDRRRLQARSVAWSEPSCLLVAGFGGIDAGHRGASSRRRLSRKRTGVLLPGNRDWCASCQPPTRGCGERGCGGRRDRERSMDWTRDFFARGWALPRHELLWGGHRWSTRGDEVGEKEEKE
jgi:hypothetical protein